MLVVVSTCLFRKDDSTEMFMAQAAISVGKFFRYADISVFTSFDEYGLSIVETLRRDSYRAKTYHLRMIRMIQVC